MAKSGNVQCHYDSSNERMVSLRMTIHDDNATVYED